MNERQRWMDRMNNVVKEFRAARTAGELLKAELERDPSFGRAGSRNSRVAWSARDGRAFITNLEGTYVTRLFAVFEAGLREYWERHRKRTTRPDMTTLMNNAVPTERFSQDCISDADEVRRYRNALVHVTGGEEPTDFTPVSIDTAKSRLCEYFNRLPPSWT